MIAVSIDLRILMKTFFFCSFLVFCLVPPTAAQELTKLQPYSRQLLFTGFTRPVKEMTLTGEVSGKCMEIRLDVGDTVTTPDVVEIDATFILLDLKKNAIAQQMTLHNLELEEKNLARYTKLMQNNSTAQATFDEAVHNTHVLRLNLQSLKAEEKRLNELLQRHTLYAPVGWQVLQRYVEPGEYIRQGEPILKLGNFTRLVVRFLLTYDELNLLQSMEDITLGLVDINSTVSAAIYRVAPDFNEEKKKISVELITRETPAETKIRWRGGLRAQLRIDGKQESTTFLVPFSALISRYEANWVVTEDGTRKKVILLGRSEMGNDAIISGNNLSAGERIVAFPNKTNTPK